MCVYVVGVYVVLCKTQKIGKRVMSGIFLIPYLKCGFGSLCGTLVMIDNWVDSYRLRHTHKMSVED